MSTRIRLQRIGRKKRPFYRIVAAEKKVKRDGKVLQILGSYDPKTNPVTFKLDKEKLLKWQKHGAQLSEAVLRLLKDKK